MEERQVQKKGNSHLRNLNRSEKYLRKLTNDMNNKKNIITSKIHLDKDYIFFCEIVNESIKKT